jgi:hypothetical protein
VRFHQSALLLLPLLPLLLSKGRPPSRTEAGIIADRPFGLSLSPSPTLDSTIWTKSHRLPLLLARFRTPNHPHLVVLKYARAHRHASTLTLAQPLQLAQRFCTMQPIQPTAAPPQWAQISFDDGFDLNLDATSSLAGPASTAPSIQSPAIPDRSIPDAPQNRFSASPASSNKALPQLPFTATAMPASVGVPSTVHARLPSAHSQDAAAATTPKPPGTPQAHLHPSPIVTAATPEQPTNRNFDAIQPPPRPVSSADAYMHPIETLQSDTNSRPGTAMSNLSSANGINPPTTNRSSFGTATTSTTTNAPFNQPKRASVLSFQTANSAGFTSADEAKSSDREHLADQTLVAAPATSSALPIDAAQPIRPWLDRNTSGYGSSPDERSFPGGLPGSFWDEPVARPPHTTAVLPEQPAPQPFLAVCPPAPPNHNPAAAAPAHADDTSSTQIGPADASLAPINTHGLAPSSPNAPLSSTTIAAPSDETTQAARQSPDVAKASVRELEPISDLDAPPPPAKDARIDDNASPAAPADNLIPPPLPTDAAANAQPTINPPALQRPVSDYRKKPLAHISPAQKAAGLAHLQSQAKAPTKQPSRDMPSNAPPTAPPTEAPPIVMMERARRKSTASLTANVALAQAAAGVPNLAQDGLADTPDTPSAESASAESSAPPDGEVEARAEWERRRIKRKNGNKNKDSQTQNKGRSDTFKSQLRPLQLVPADNVTAFSDRNAATADRHSIAVANRTANAIAPATSDAPAPAAAASAQTTYSTQQLQRLQAREQRRSVGAFSAAMAAANVVSSGSNGPYPVFASPNSGPQKVGARQYPGLMAQRSLVPPFELQHRPDGLPSGMIGPDGVRRSINDPEVCLECMMRDEDMIDIRVVGDGVWERESDKDFQEAVRQEAEDAASGPASHGMSGSSGHADSLTSHRDSRQSRKARKRIGKGEPLTVERLKLHTQMNPPASSFRWRTLQTFLAVQAKYIAMEQQRMRLEVDKRARHNNDSVSSRGSFVADSPVAAGVLSSPFAPARDASSPQRQSILSTSVDDSTLTPLQKQEKERDVAAAQAARKKMTVGTTPPMAPTPPLGMPAYSVTPLQTCAAPQSIPARVASDPDGVLGGASPVGGVSMTPSSSRRVPFASAPTARAASAQDLRSMADGQRSAGYPASPDSLMPPSRSVMGTSPTGTPSRLAARSGASQLSLMHSGSMIDMHVAQEDRAEHRIKQNGFLPGTPLAVESPAAMNRSYYGFPGDGDSSLPDPAAFERSRMVSGDGYVNPMQAGPRGLDADHDDNKRKKKGLRGLFSKLTGGSAAGRENSTGGMGDGSINGSVASRNASRRSQASDSSKPRKFSFSAERSLDTSGAAASPNGMLSRARRSTSTFFRNGAEPDVEAAKPRQPSAGNSNTPFQNPPGMTSQGSLDLGPFQPASPQANAFGAANGSAARMRKASNPLMQKYLSSPSPQTQASPVPSSVPTSPVERVAVHPSQRDARVSGLQPIPDGEQVGDEYEPRQSVRSSGSASVRKELPAMPTLGGRPSMDSGGPQRPPRNPRRPEGALNSPSLVDLSINGGGVGQGRREFPQPSRYESGSYASVASRESETKRSRFRLPFGRKKRESTLGEPKPSIVVGGAEEDGVRGGLFPALRTRKSYGGLGVPKASFSTERQRVLSSPSHDMATLPPRSQSAFGMAPTQRFMSMDLPRRSMNVGRADHRLSTVGYEEEDEDDEMEREPGYEAEFNRYAQEAAEERYVKPREASAGGQSFGRKSLNLLLDLRMPLGKTR